MINVTQNIHEMRRSYCVNRYRDMYLQELRETGKTGAREPCPLKEALTPEEFLKRHEQRNILTRLLCYTDVHTEARYDAARQFLRENQDSDISRTMDELEK